MDLANLYSDNHWCPYPGVVADLNLSFRHTEKASLCSGWDGHKGTRGPGGYLLTDRVAPHEAQYALYEALSSGHYHGTAGVVEADEEKAIFHLIQAAEGGHKEAQHDLYAHYHSLGEVKEATGWLLKAAAPTTWVHVNENVGKKDYPWVEIECNLILSTRHGTNVHWRNCYLRRATRDLEEHAKAGNLDAILDLYEFYQGEYCLRRPNDPNDSLISLHKSCVDNEKALHCLREVAFAGFPIAAHRLYHVFREGQFGVDVDLKEAFKWLSLAASNGAKYCQFALASMYLGKCEHVSREGTSSPEFGYVEVNHEKGLRWLKKAARNGQKDALYRIGQCYQYALHIGAENTVHLTCAFEEDRGFFGENDEYKRVEEGEVHLWIPHEKQLVLRNSDMALRCYIKAARAGSIEAMEELAFIYNDRGGSKINQGRSSGPEVEGEGQDFEGDVRGGGDPKR